MEWKLEELVTNYENYRYARIKDEVDHQGIGGKIIKIEKEMPINYALDYPFDHMPIALYNFVARRIVNWQDVQKIYYGHVDYLGYYIADDEIKEWI